MNRTNTRRNGRRLQIAGTAFLCTFASGCALVVPQEPRAATTVYAVDLAAPTQAELATLRGGAKDRPLAVGFGREIPAERQRIRLDQVRWQRNDNAGFTATIAVRSTGAKSLRVGLHLNNPPSELNLAFKESGAEIVVPASLIVASAPEIYWSPVITGDVAEFELRSPNRPAANAVLVLERVSHLP